jgi:hypothetical protein
MHIHLRGRQANALGVVHGVEHLRDQGFQARINFLHGLGHLVQTRIGITKNGKQGHGTVFQDVAIFATFWVSCRPVGAYSLP